VGGRQRVHWIAEYRFDGFRIDATQNVYDFDEGHEHILAEFARAARDAAAADGGREILLVGENEPQLMRLIRPREAGGYGLDALWNDDFHHCAIVALTGRSEAYLTDHRGSPQEFVSAAKYGFLYQGQRYRWQGQPRGTTTEGLEPAQFVNFTQNHDQVANMGRGLRQHHLAGAGRNRAVTALLLLSPGTPLLFQGQEFGASQPFLFFLDNADDPDQAEAVDKGRRKEVSQFLSLAEPEVQAVLRRPDDPETFRMCKLDWAEAERNREHVLLHKDLLRLRREDATLVAARRPGTGAGAAAAWTGPCSGRTRSACASWGRRRRPPAAGQPRPRPRADRDARAAAGARRGDRLGGALVERAPEVRRHRRPAPAARPGLGAAGPRRAPAAPRAAPDGAQDRAAEGAGEGRVAARGARGQGGQGRGAAGEEQG
jgi:1,4-alpha-glucan branching enzyme